MTDNASRIDGVGGTMSDSVGSFGSTSSVGAGDEDEPAHPHHLKLLALSEVLMCSPVPNKAGKTKNKEAPSTVNGSNTGLLEEARNRWRGRKERCVHWDRVEINGREFPLQRADTSSIPQQAMTNSGGLAGTGQSNTSELGTDKAHASYLLVGHSTCDMCLMEFEASSVSGVITMKRILEARRDWGLVGEKSKKYAAASNLYEPARLCALCSQFFCSKDADGRVGGEGGELVACGVGRSDEHVSLSLENMASNKPLPDKGTTALAKVVTKSGGGCGASAGSGGMRPNQHRRRRDAGGSNDSATTATNCSSRSSSSGRKEARSLKSAATSPANFRLDELIADDRFVVKETDLARQAGAVASQSSTADGMGADVCMGFPAANRRGGAEGWGTVHSTSSGTPSRSPNPAALTNFQSEGESLLESSIGDPTLVTPTAASASTKTSTATALTVVQQALSSAPSTKSQKRSPPLPAPKMCPDEIAAAAAAAARTCSRTRRENQPWWEIDLGGAFPVRCIRVHHPDRRTEATKAGASPFVDVSPFWIMTSAGAIGDATPEEAKQLAISSKRVGSHGKVTVWNLGVNHFAAAVRVQAEGVKSLQLAR